MNLNFYKNELYIILLALNMSFISNLKSEEIEKNYIIIPFRSYFPKFDFSLNENKAIINSWVRRKLYLDIENESKQKIQIILNTKFPQIHTKNVTALLTTEEEYYNFYNIYETDICTFNFKNSNSYEFISEFNRSFYSIKNVCYAKEKIFLYKDLNLKKRELFNIEFIHSSNETHICFFGGLLITNNIADKKVNLIHQLKQLINSNSYSWSLKFTSPDSGLFIFGDIINNKNLNFYNDNIEDNYITYEIPTYSLDTISWKLYFEKINIGDYVIKPKDQMYFFINFQIRYITVPRSYFYDIQLQYLLTNENITDPQLKFICFDEETEFFFHSIYCKKKEYLKLTDNYKKLPTLNLFGYRLGVNITFTPKELFLEKEDKIYFYIAYNSHEEEDWYMGTIFFEKYLTIFNNEEKTLSILKIGDKKEIESKESLSYKVILIIVLVIIINSLIFAFLGIFYGKKIYNKRKKKANELSDDEYDYSSQNPQSINNEQTSLNNLVANQ